MEKLKIEDLKKEIERYFESYESYVTDYYNNSDYIGDIIEKISDDNVDIYNYDLLEWAQHNYYYIEEYVKNFGIDNENFDFFGIIRGGQFLYIEQMLYENKNDMLLYLTYYILQQQNIEEITEEENDKLTSIDFENIDTITDLENELDKIFETKGVNKNE